MGERGGDGCEQRPDEDEAREGLAPAAQELPDAEEDQGHRDRGQDPPNPVVWRRTPSPWKMRNCGVT